MRAALICPRGFLDNLTVLNYLKVTVTRLLRMPPTSWRSDHRVDYDRYDLFISNILRAIPLPTSLDSLTFAWEPNSRLRERSQMLHVLFGPHVRESMGRFRNIKRFTVDLEEPSGGFDVNDWKTILTNVLPHLRDSCIMVKILIVPGK